MQQLTRQNAAQEFKTSVVNRLSAPAVVDFLRLANQWPGGQQLYNTRKGKAVHRVDAGLNLPAASILLTANPIKTGAVNMKNTTPAVFNFQTHEVRTVTRDGEVWFVAADVCNALGYQNSRKAIADHLDADEKGVTNRYTPGGDQVLTIINESGLYALVLRSRKPEARKFAKWVTSEVLPTIRKTGSYTTHKEIEPETLNALALRELLKPGRRFMTIFGRDGETTTPIMYAIPQDAAVLTPAEMVKHVGDAGGFPINLIPALISAAATRMQGILPGKKQ